MDLRDKLHRYSEWLDSEGLIVGDGPESDDKRTHDELVAGFLAQDETAPVTEPLTCGV